MLSESKRPWVKYFIAGWAFVECLLFAGILYGWGSLVFIFKAEGIFSDLCEEQTSDKITDLPNIQNATTNERDNYLMSNLHGLNGTNTTSHSGQEDAGRSCVPQDSRMSLCFTVSSSIFCVSCVVMGALNYKLGTRITRLISFPCFIVGGLCFAFLSKDLPWLMYPGLSLIGIGGLPVFVTNTQVSNLFLTGSSSVVGLLVGGYDMSSAVFLTIKLGFQQGFSRRNCFFLLCGVHLMTLISTIFFLPKGFIEQQTSDNSEPPDLSHNLLTYEQSKPRRRSSALQDKHHRGRRPSIADPQPLRSYLIQPLFLTHNVWLCILQLRFYYFIGNLNTYLNRVLNNDISQVSYFTNVCFYTMMGGLVTSFLAGIVYDSQKSLFSGGKTKLYRSLMPALLPLSLASVLSIILSILVLIPNTQVLYAIFIVMTMLRSFLYSLAAAFITDIFPSQYFALLYGVTMIAAGLFSLFQYALFSWSEGYPNAPLHVEIFLLCAGLVSAVHPAYMLVCSWREERQQPAKPRSQDTLPLHDSKKKPLT